MTPKKIYTLENPADFLREFDAKGVKGSFSEWTGGHREPEVRERLERGDSTYVVEAEAAIQEIMANLHLENLRNEWFDDVAGCLPNVPAYLAGVPLTMRRKHIVSVEISPIKIFISLASSGGISIDVLKRRGICLLALVIALTSIRPVELWVFDGDERQVVLVKMPTAPLDIGLISFILVNQSFIRGLMYPFLDHHIKYWTSSAPITNIDHCRDVAGAEGADVVFPPIHLNENYSDPTKWVKERLQKILDLNKETIENLI